MKTGKHPRATVWRFSNAAALALAGVYALSLPLNGPAAVAANPDPVSAAYEYLYRSMDEYSSQFDVYTDADAAGNHYYPSGYYNGTANMTVDTRWTANPRSGSSCIRVHWNGQSGRDGWLWNGVLFEEPEGYLDHRAGNGYDLTGSTTLSFWARTDEPGLSVEFGFGHILDDSCGEHKRWIALGQAWQRFEFDLTGLDLSRVHAGFLFAFNDVNDPDPNGTTFYIDDIQYDLARPEALRLIRSFTTITDTDQFDVRNKNMATIYDNALAIMALLIRGTNEDVRRAAILADTLVFAHENDVNVVPADWPHAPPPFNGHRLRDAYEAGYVQDPQGNFRYPGWWEEQAQMWYMHESALSFRTGDLAWVIMALAKLHAATGKAKYLNAAKEMGEWIASKCERQGTGADSGYRAGWVWKWDQSAWLAHGASTEHNIDLVAAFAMLHHLTGDQEWKDRSDHAREFLEAMWSPVEGYFRTGVNADGTPSTVNVLDVQAWGALVLQRAPYWRALDWAAQHLSVDKVGDGDRECFDFNDDLDGVWYEGTAQMVVAYTAADRRAKADDSLAALRKAQTDEPNADGRGIVAADLYGLTTGFDWEYYDRLALGSTCWFIFAEHGYDPFEVEGPLTVRVDDDNKTGIEDGSAEHPFDTIQEGLNAVRDGGTVKVARGTYTENLTITGKTVTILGGYIGGTDYATAAGDFDDANRAPDPSTNNTWIDGDGIPIKCQGGGTGSLLSGFTLRSNGAIFRGSIRLQHVIARRK